LITLDKTAELLGCSTRTVRRLISSGELTGIRIGHTHLLRVPLDEVNAFGTKVSTVGDAS
jgi:excisionase family DNA binding protein